MGDASVTLVPPTHAWSISVGASGREDVRFLEVAADDSFFLAGLVSGTYSLGGPAMPTVGGNDAYLAHFDPAGMHRYTVPLGSTANDNAFSLVLDAARVYVCGQHNDGLDFGAGPTASSGGTDGFVAAFDRSDGAYGWARVFGTAVTSEQASSLALAPDGSIYATFRFQGTLSLGGSSLVSRGGLDMGVARFDPAGTVLSAFSFGTTGSDDVRSIAVDGAGRLFVAGRFEGTLALGTDSLVSSGTDGVVVSFDGDGTYRWSAQIGGAAYDEAQHVGLDDAGNVYVAANIDVDQVFGIYNHRGVEELWVASFTNEGVPRWEQRYGGAGPGQAIVRQFRTGPGGALYLGGFYWGAIDFGGGALTNAGSEDAFVVRLASDGRHVWSLGFGGPMDESVEGIDVTSDGGLLVAGNFQGSVDFGGGPLTAGFEDVFVVRLR